jgi:hypothetical protein
MADYDWLSDKHPVYKDNVDLWKKNERRHAGGEEVLSELRPFEWEESDEDAKLVTSHYQRRQGEAVYINFVDLFARTLVGHMFKKHPEEDGGLDFGTLGNAIRQDGAASPDPAEILYEDLDGVGNQSSQWPNFWSSVAEMAMVTGHRWIYCEGAPGNEPQSRADELAGLRPYLVEYSPIQVTNWHYDNRGRLQFAVVLTAVREPKVTEDGRFEGNDYEDGYLLLVAPEYEALGKEFKVGGWFMFNSDKELIGQGNPGWEATKGEVPLWIHYYERARSSNERLRISRPGTTELGQAAVAYMNLSSAADYDVWDAGQSIAYLLGVDENAWALATDKLTSGSKWIPLPPNQKTGEIPQVYDGSAGAVAHANFETRLERKLIEAERLASLEASGAPESSGESKKAGFADIRAPRLSLLASEMEQSQNISLWFLELRWSGGKKSPTGSIEWAREFELLPLTDSIRELFELESMAGAKSPTLDVKAIVMAARMKGLIANDEEADQITRELEEALTAAETEAAQQEALEATEAEVADLLRTTDLAAEAEGTQLAALP